MSDTRITGIVETVTETAGPHRLDGCVNGKQIRPFGNVLDGLKYILDHP